MEPLLKNEYERLCKKGIESEKAFQWAKINIQFEELEQLGLVRLNIIPDQDLCIWSSGDLCSKERIEYEGYWLVTSEFRLSSEDLWQVADGCGGFIGNDWIDSGYDIDFKTAALKSLDEIIERQEKISNIAKMDAAVLNAAIYRIKCEEARKLNLMEKKVQAAYIVDFCISANHTIYSLFDLK